MPWLQGGMVVLSGDAFHAYRQLSRRAWVPDAMLLHAGDHIIVDPAKAKGALWTSVMH